MYRWALPLLLHVACGRTEPWEKADFAPDAGLDAGRLDAGRVDGGLDAGLDAGRMDAGLDAGPRDAGVDAGVARCPCVGPRRRLPQPSVLRFAPEPLGRLEPGRYCWEWVGGAFVYANNPCWVVSAVQPGYRILNSSGTIVSSMTGGSGCPSTQLEAEAFFFRNGRPALFTWDGGTASIVLEDPDHGGNAEGSPSPSFTLCAVP